MLLLLYQHDDLLPNLKTDIIVILIQQYICDRHIFDAVLRCFMVFRMQRLI